MKKKLILFTLGCLLLAVTLNAADQPGNPRSIILFIGDGMGPAQVTAAVMMGKGDNFRRFTYSGLALTRSSDSWITDSAASATAIATGKHTYNKAIGVDDDKNSLKTVLEYAEERGMSTGLVATSSVTHATPASFAAHVEKRSMEVEIALQLATSGVDVIIGGGEKFFVTDDIDGKREDDRNLLEERRNEGATIITDMESLLKLDTEKVTELLATLEWEHLEREKHPDETLAAMTQIAIDILDNNPNGFFLMVEGSQIDWEGHGNDYSGVLFEMEDFNGALGVALDYAEEHPDLLIVTTADHETGGLTLEIDKGDKTSKFDASWTTRGHTGVVVPIFSQGPRAEEFSGLLDNFEIGLKLIEMVTAKTGQ